MCGQYSFVQFFCQVLFSSENEALHFAQAALHDLCYLQVGEVFEAVEYQGGTLLVSEVTNGSAQLFYLLAVDNLLLRVTVVTADFRQMLHTVGRYEAAGFAQLLADGVDRDSIDERAQFRVEAESGQGNVELDEDLLGHLLDVKTRAA